MLCPKCHKEIEDTAIECPHCHIQVRMFIKRQKQLAESAKNSSPAAEGEKAPSALLNPVTIMLVIVVVIWGYYYFTIRSAKSKLPPEAPATVEQPAAAAPEAAPAQVAAERVPSIDEKPETVTNTQEGLEKVDELLKRTAPMLPGHPQREKPEDQ